MGREIERKWLFTEVPNYPIRMQADIYQSYLSTDPEVRIESKHAASEINGEIDSYVLCLKGGGALVRCEIEKKLTRSEFYDLAAFIDKPAITKAYTVFLLPDGLVLQFSIVDAGWQSSFMYGEVEFPNVAAAKAFVAPEGWVEVTENPHWKMKNYWQWRCRG